MKKRSKEVRRFHELSKASARVELALLAALPLVYTERMGERIVRRENWKAVVLRDLTESTMLAYFDTSTPPQRER